MYAAGRCFKTEAAVSGQVRSSRSIVPGSRFANILLKMVRFLPLDRVASCWSGTELTLYVGGMQVIVTREFVQAVAWIIKTLEGVLRLPVSRDTKSAKGKSAYVASAGGVGTAVQSQMKGMGIACKSTQRWLGVDYAAGRRAPQATRRARRFAARKRQPKIRGIAKKGGRVAKVVRGGLVTSVGYGARCVGVSNTDLREIRRYMGAALPGGGGWRSLTLRLALGGDEPAKGLAVAPLVAWAEEIWGGEVDQRIMQKAWLAQMVKQAGRPLEEVWREVRGPAAATVASVRRLGWTMPSPWAICSPEGQLWDMRQEGPRDIRAITEEAFEVQLLDQWVDQVGKDVLAPRPFVEPLRRLIQRRLTQE